MSNVSRALPALVLAAFILSSLSTPVFSQTPAQQSDKPKDLWDNFIYYIKIAHPVLAVSNGNALLESTTTAREVYRLSQLTPNLEDILKRGERLAGMKDVIARMRKRIKQGFREEAANPEEIEKSIAMLSGTLGQYQEGVRRLKLSGEYCLPQLVQHLSDVHTTLMMRE
ncbi:MAG: hypothetical protein J7M14_01200 [Planctomycetes bacterium]|nr:hypothetical protein [Planctomycetota bacterium]